MLSATKPMSSAEFFAASSENAEQAQSLRNHVQKRRLVSHMAALRASKGITQADLAQAMGCGQARVSKLEAGVDANLTFADVEAYAKATGSTVTVLINDRKQNLAEQIKWHAVSIRAAFLKLVDYARNDEEIAKGVAKLHSEAFQNINAMLAETAGKLPCDNDGRPYVEIVEASSNPAESPIAKETATAPRSSAKKPRSTAKKTALPR